MSLIRFLIYFLLLVNSQLGFAQVDAADTPSVTASSAAVVGSGRVVYLATMQPGQEFWERFGHNAIVIADQPFEQTQLAGAASYNFGYFDFRQKNFFLNFARGKMQYLGLVENAAGDLSRYLQMGRQVTLQRLALREPQIAALEQYLKQQTSEPNQIYRYDYFRANCSTRVRDALDLALDGAIAQAVLGRSHGYTYRSLGLAHAQGVPWMYLGIHAGLGPSADQPLSIYQESFIPELLRRAVRNVKLKDAQGQSYDLVQQEILLGKDGIAQVPVRVDLRWYFLVSGLTIGILIAIGFRFRRQRALRYLSAGMALLCAGVMGLGGLLLLFLWFGTDHGDAKSNLNITVFSPLMLFALLSLAQSARATWQPSALLQRALRWTLIGALLALLIKVLPAVKQQNIEWYLLLLPVLLALVVSCRTKAMDA